jgi:uncharacterized membrane protein YeaQ/YmgE (transglycosylase-associated protein family)
LSPKACYICALAASQRLSTKGSHMESLVPIIIQLVFGAIGGNAAGKAMPDKSLGTLGNTIAGVIGGVGGGKLLGMLLGGGAMATDAATGVAASGLDIGAIIQDVAGGGIGGAVLTIVVALIKGAMNKS